ncbi:ROK family protein [Rhodococcus sp. NPDC057529]|uniref:ROK family transcriptional regulator n=1 Tax=Rhodococcus sp. NPDC057529 TaxID=3346158 RepID=UPI00366BF017
MDSETSRLAQKSPRGGSQRALRETNTRLVLGCLAEFGELTQAELARRSGVSTSTVSNIVSDLDKTGVIVRDAGASGRRGQVVRLAPSTGYVAGIDIGHRHMRVALSARDRRVVAEERVPLPNQHSHTMVAPLISKSIDRLVADTGARRSQISVAGMAFPAAIDTTTGELLTPSILPGWSRIDIAATLSQALGLTVYVDNDANLGAIAEQRQGAARGASDVVYLKLSDGVGAGIITGGRLLRGSDGTAGEMGHTMINSADTVCRCGNRGCLETLVSTRRVLSLLEPIHGANLTIAQVVEAARSGDHACGRVLGDVGRTVGVAVANVCNILNPALVVVGGELALGEDLLLDPMREVVMRNAMPGVTRNLTIRSAQLGGRAQLVGALSIALRAAPLPVPIGAKR